MGFELTREFMKLLLILTILNFLTIQSKVFASALVCKKGEVLEVKADLNFYGSRNDLGAECAKEISRMFNEPNAHLKIGSKDYAIKFVISEKKITEDQAYDSSTLNKKPETNFIRIEKRAENDKDGRSNQQIANNCGFYASNDDLGKSTTCAHEFAHSLGLDHYDVRPETKDNKDLRGKGQPGIMAARGYLVDAQYQYDPKAQVWADGGTIDPAKRKVLLQDLYDLNLDKLNYNSKGCAELGRASNITYKGDGSSEWQGWKDFKGALKSFMTIDVPIFVSKCTIGF